MNKTSLEPVPARRGNSSWQLKIKAKAGHSSLLFSKNYGAGAIYPLARVLNHFYQELHKEKYLTFNIGNAAGGSSNSRSNAPDPTEISAFGKTNVIPATAEANGDIRTLSEKQLLSVRNRMKSILKFEIDKFDKEYAREAALTGEIDFEDSYPPMPPRAGNLELAKKFAKVSRDLDGSVLKNADPITQGAADIAFVAAGAEGALDGLGPNGVDFHTEKESTDQASLKLAIKRAVLLIHRLSKSSSGIGISGTDPE